MQTVFHLFACSIFSAGCEQIQSEFLDDPLHAFIFLSLFPFGSVSRSLFSFTVSVERPIANIHSIQLSGQFNESRSLIIMKFQLICMHTHISRFRLIMLHKQMFIDRFFDMHRNFLLSLSLFPPLAYFHVNSRWNACSCSASSFFSILENFVVQYST